MKSKNWLHIQSKARYLVAADKGRMSLIQAQLIADNIDGYFWCCGYS